MVPDSKSIEVGQDVYFDHVPKDSELVQLRCTNIQQRNWSRVGIAVPVELQEAEPRQYFLKQNVDRAGRSQSEHWKHEQSGALVARQLLGDVANVPMLRFQNETQLINVFDYTDVIPLDHLLRSDPQSFNASFPAVLDMLIAVLQAMQAGATDSIRSSLPVKQRPYGGPSNAVNFKGFEIRNVGLGRKADSSVDSGNLVMFDAVRPYLAPIEEASAKLFVSIGLLNWGKPMGRFIRGPDRELLALASAALQGYLSKQAIDAEINLQSSFRSGEILGANSLERTLKGLGVQSIGKYYFRQLRDWCDQNIPER